MLSFWLPSVGIYLLSLSSPDIDSSPSSGSSSLLN